MLRQLPSVSAGRYMLALSEDNNAQQWRGGGVLTISIPCDPRPLSEKIIFVDRSPRAKPGRAGAEGYCGCEGGQVFLRILLCTEATRTCNPLHRHAVSTRRISVPHSAVRFKRLRSLSFYVEIG